MATTKKTAAKKKARKGGVRIAELASKGKKVEKKIGKKIKTSSLGKSAYQFVTENVAGSPLLKLQRKAAGVFDQLQKTVSGVLGGGSAADDETDYPKLRRQWIKKRLARTLKRKR